MIKKSRQRIEDVLSFKENKSIKIGVTGTNGKSTLVHYLNQALNYVSSSIALGNIGNPLLDNIKHKNKYYISSYSTSINVIQT